MVSTLKLQMPHARCTWQVLAAHVADTMALRWQAQPTPAWVRCRCLVAGMGRRRNYQPCGSAAPAMHKPGFKGTSVQSSGHGLLQAGSSAAWQTESSKDHEPRRLRSCPLGQEALHRQLKAQVRAEPPWGMACHRHSTNTWTASCQVLL